MSNAPSWTVDIELERCERFLVGQGWYRSGAEWRHRNLAFGWTLDDALRLEAEAEQDEDMADAVCGMLRGVY